FIDDTSEDKGAVDKLIVRYGLQGRKIILHPCRIAPRKGQEHTILAAAELFRISPDLKDKVSFVILGPERDIDSDERLRLRTLARRLGVDVIFVEGVPYGELKSWYQAAYLVLYPTLAAEPFGLVSVEAQASGTPVIIYNVGGLSETMLDKETGFTIEPGNFVALGRKIYELIKDECQRNEIGSRGRDFTSRRFSPENRADDYGQRIINAVNNPRVNCTAGEIPEDPYVVLDDIYNEIIVPLSSAQKDIYQPCDSAVVRRLKRLWADRLKESARRFYLIDHDLSENRASMAYNPLLVPYVSMAMGQLNRLIIPAMKASKVYSVVYDDNNQHKEVIYLEYWPASMSVDPFDDGYMDAVNTFPKVEFDSLIFSRRWMPQKLSSRSVRVGLRWAKEGAVVEFHRTEKFVPHFHLHLYARETVPLPGLSNTWESAGMHNNVEMGKLRYLVPHVAMRSICPELLKRAVMSMSDLLEAREDRFIMDIIPGQGIDEMIVLFFVLPRKQYAFGFSGSGMLKVSDTETEVDPEALLKDLILNGGYLSQIRDSFWSLWTASASSPIVVGFYVTTRASSYTASSPVTLTPKYQGFVHGGLASAFSNWREKTPVFARRVSNNAPPIYVDGYALWPTDVLVPRSTRERKISLEQALELALYHPYNRTVIVPTKNHMAVLHYLAQRAILERSRGPVALQQATGDTNDTVKKLQGRFGTGRDDGIAFLDFLDDYFWWLVILECLEILKETGIPQELFTDQAGKSIDGFPVFSLLAKALEIVGYPPTYFFTHMSALVGPAGIEPKRVIAPVLDYNITPLLKSGLTFAEAKMRGAYIVARRFNREINERVGFGTEVPIAVNNEGIGMDWGGHVGFSHSSEVFSYSSFELIEHLLAAFKKEGLDSDFIHSSRNTLQRLIARENENQEQWHKVYGDLDKEFLRPDLAVPIPLAVGINNFWDFLTHNEAKIDPLILKLMVRYYLFTPDRLFYFFAHMPKEVYSEIGNSNLGSLKNLYIELMRIMTLLERVPDYGVTQGPLDSLRRGAGEVFLVGNGFRKEGVIDYSVNRTPGPHSPSSIGQYRSRYAILTNDAVGRFTKEDLARTYECEFDVPEGYSGDEVNAWWEKSGAPYVNYPQVNPYGPIVKKTYVSLSSSSPLGAYVATRASSSPVGTYVTTRLTGQAVSSPSAAMRLQGVGALLRVVAPSPIFHNNGELLLYMGRAVLFAGEQGVGKSSLAIVALARRQWQ
ncbi:MAG: glycosyltransferase family 4 protein, partial [Candidatus Omnitrophota bacterium]